MRRFPWIELASFSCALVGVPAFSGCAKVDDLTSLQQSVEKFEQKLVLNVDGKTVELPLEKLDIFLTEDEEHPEIYELHGTGVVLAGTFPKEVRVDYGDHWEQLVEKSIAISPTGGDPREVKTSSLTLPGQPAMKVLGGTFTVEKFSEGFDAKTPLTGRIEIKVESPEGKKTYQGKFTVKGTTWG